MKGNTDKPTRTSDPWQPPTGNDTDLVTRPKPTASQRAPRDGVSPLRLVGTGEAPRQPIGSPIVRATDPRWVLALRVVEMMEGPILEPRKRERLIRLGQAMGLTAFDSNMVIAIMQDQARRGVSPDVCPRSGLAQLNMVSPSRVAERDGRLTRSGAWWFGLTLAALVAIELLLIFGWIG